MEVKASPDALFCKDQPKEDSRDSFGLSSMNSAADTAPGLYLYARPKSLASFSRMQSYLQPVKIAPKTILLTSQHKQPENLNKKNSRSRLKKVFFKVLFKFQSCNSNIFP